MNKKTNNRNDNQKGKKIPSRKKTIDIKEITERIEEFKLNACHDCKALPGEPHKPGCDVEVCSVCGGKRLQEHFTGNICKEHDPGFARWTGFWPGGLEADALGIDMNTFYDLGLNKIFLVKPKMKQKKSKTNNNKL